jgi:hypothetical protein
MKALHVAAVPNCAAADYDQPMIGDLVQTKRAWSAIA